LAWENAEQRLIAFYRQLLGRELSTSIVKPNPQESVAANDRSA